MSAFERGGVVGLSEIQFPAWYIRRFRKHLEVAWGRPNLRLSLITSIPLARHRNGVALAPVIQEDPILRENGSHITGRESRTVNGTKSSVMP